MRLDDDYAVYIDKSFQKWVDKNLPKKLHVVLREKVQYFQQNPYHPSLNTKPYSCSSSMKQELRRQGIDEVFEFYINRKQYRCVLYVAHEQKEIFIVYVGTHDQLKKRLSR